MDPSFHDLGGFSNRGRYYKKPTILLWGYHGIGMIRYDIYIYYPYAPCMEYLPAFTLKITQMYVNIPYMEHMGYTHI